MVLGRLNFITVVYPSLLAYFLKCRSRTHCFLAWKYVLSNDAVQASIISMHQASGISSSARRLLHSWVPTTGSFFNGDCGDTIECYLL